MRKSIYIAMLPILGIIFVVSCKKKKEEKGFDCASIEASYSTSIKLIVESSCNLSSCHNAGSLNGDFTTYAGLQQKANNGTLNNRVLVRKDMPPSGALSQDKLDKIKCWIDNGAPNN